MGLGSSSESSSRQVFSVRGRFYRFIDIVGQGSEATVYRCEDQNAIQYAVKVFYYSRFPPSTIPQRVATFNKEARILKYLSQRSRHFVQLYDYEYNPMENIGYMIMELADGSLRDQLMGAPLDDELRRMYWKQIVTILRELQNAQIVHADIKPDNMVLVGDVLKVTDLGLAFRLASPQQAMRRPRVRGTLDYMAPEIFHHQTGFKSDIWSAAVILYEMTYGRPPFFNFINRNQKVAVISSRRPVPFPPIRDTYLMDIMRRCLQPDIRRRPDAYQLQMHPYTRM